jgi:serine/threonine-protein phosphatase 2A catalytic subunit
MSDSIECITLLLCFKVRYPQRIFLLRGLNEIRVESEFVFYNECLAKYSNSNVFKYLCDVFNYLPIGAIINNQIFCVHGGLSPDIETLDAIEAYDRKQILPKYEPLWGLVCDIPSDGDVNEWYWPKYYPYVFGPIITKKFNQRNNLKYIISGSKYTKYGFEWFHDNNLCIIFSAPNIWQCGNLAAIMNIDENIENNIIQYGPALIPIKQNENNNKRIPDYFN